MEGVADVRASLRDMEAMTRTRSITSLPTSAERKVDAVARDLLATQVASLPPSAVVSKAALAAFKAQHVEMMKVTGAARK